MKKLIIMAVLFYGGYHHFSSLPVVNSFDEAGNPATILFTINDCSPCDDARDYLTKRKIEFQEYIVQSEGDEAYKKLRKAGGRQQFPYLISGNQSVTSFNQYSYTGLFAEVLGADFLTPVERELLAKNFDSSGQAKIVMYSSTTCGYCTQARQYLNSKNIPFTELFIDKNSKAKRHYQLLGASGTPLFYIGYRRINGFNKSLLKSVIAKKLNV